MKISFIGVGIMGVGMALNLAKFDGDYLVNDLDPLKLEPFIAKGIKTTTSNADTYDSDIIFLCLPNTKELLFGQDGFINHLGKGQIIVDSSTLHYQEAQKNAKRLEEKGIEYIDAPVAGRAEKAMVGKLTIMCGGKEEVFNRIKRYLEMMGEHVFYMGKSGSGQVSKMVNNCISYISLTALCEMLPLAVKLGLDPEKIGTLINHSSARSNTSEKLIPRMLEGDFTYDTMNACYKTLVNATDICMKLNVPMPALKGTMQAYQTAMLQGYGEDYYTAMIHQYEDMLGVKFRKDPNMD